MEQNTCCFIGHREINETDELKLQLCRIIENLITEKGVDTFLFGSKSRFNSLCYELVSKLKEKHPHIKRIYVRAEFEHIDTEYKAYLLQSYEDTYFSKGAVGGGKAVYVKRNFEMIEKSQFCVIYYEKDYQPQNRKSGTKIALDYAVKKQRKIFLLPDTFQNQ